MGSLPAKTGASVVLIDPKQPQRVYAAGDTGLYRSDDAGETWQAAAQGLPSDGSVALALAHASHSSCMQRQQQAPCT